MAFIREEVPQRHDQNSLLGSFVHHRESRFFLSFKSIGFFCLETGKDLRQPMAMAISLRCFRSYLSPAGRMDPI